MLTVLSLMDERSRPKGSRDPLGIEAIWSYMGRKVVGNLTTVTSNLDNFMVGLLCCAHASTNTDQLDQIQTNYLRAEQLAAYLRLAAGNENFLGITRAKANFSNGQSNGLLPLGSTETAQILSNQLSYGLWGLYSTAMQVACLISGPERRLTASGRELVAEMIACMGDDQWHTFNTLAQSSQVSMAGVTALAPGFNRLLRDPQLRRSVVRALLLNWQHEGALQLELYGKAMEYLSHFNGEISVSAFCQWLGERTEISAELRMTIAQIQSLEPLLVLAATLMEWLQGQKGGDHATLCNVLQPRILDLNLSAPWQMVAGLPHRAFLTRLFDAGNAQDADALINCVLEQNKVVMQQRGGAAWLEWQGDALMVRVANDRASLPDSINTHCHGRWWNSYFIGSFLQIAKQAMS